VCVRAAVKSSRYNTCVIHFRIDVDNTEQQLAAAVFAVRQRRIYDHCDAAKT